MPFNYTSLSLLPTLTLGFDKFPNNTAVSNYFIETGPATPGAITGSATARLTTFTNTSGSRYIPTCHAKTLVARALSLLSAA
jgi:hypothetical protein